MDIKKIKEQHEVYKNNMLLNKAWYFDSLKDILIHNLKKIKILEEISFFVSIDPLKKNVSIESNFSGLSISNASQYYNLLQNHNNTQIIVYLNKEIAHIQKKYSLDIQTFAANIKKQQSVYYIVDSSNYIEIINELFNQVSNNIFPNYKKYTEKELLFTKHIDNNSLKSKQRKIL